MDKVKEVKWKSGFGGRGKADIAFKELERIKTKNGGILTAGIVVIEATKARNPLHKQFQWDDDKAASEFRLEQARSLLRSIHVVYAKAPQIPPQRHYIAVTQSASKDAPERKVYRSTAEILADPIARDEMLANAIRDALAFRRKYAELQELAQVFASFDDFLVTNKAV